MQPFRIKKQTVNITHMYLNPVIKKCKRLIDLKKQM